MFKKNVFVVSQLHPFMIFEIQLANFIFCNTLIFVLLIYSVQYHHTPICPSFTKAGTTRKSSVRSDHDTTLGLCRIFLSRRESKLTIERRTHHYNQAMFRTFWHRTIRAVVGHRHSQRFKDQIRMIIVEFRDQSASPEAVTSLPSLTKHGSTSVVDSQRSESTPLLSGTRRKTGSVGSAPSLTT